MLLLKQFNAREEFFAITRVHLNIYCTFLLRRSYTRKIVRKFSQSAKSTTPKMKISRPFIWTFLKASFRFFKVRSYNFDISSQQIRRFTLKTHEVKVEKIQEDSLDSIPSPSVKIHGWERYKCNALLGVVNKHLDTKSLLTIPSNVLSLPIKQTFPHMI